MHISQHLSRLNLYTHTYIKMESTKCMCLRCGKLVYLDGDGAVVARERRDYFGKQRHTLVDGTKKLITRHALRQMLEGNNVKYRWEDDRFVVTILYTDAVIEDITKIWLKYCKQECQEQVQADVSVLLQSVNHRLDTRGYSNKSDRGEGSKPFEKQDDEVKKALNAFSQLLTQVGVVSANSKGAKKFGAISLCLQGEWDMTDVKRVDGCPIHYNLPQRVSNDAEHSEDQEEEEEADAEMPDAGERGSENGQGDDSSDSEWYDDELTEVDEE